MVGKEVKKDRKNDGEGSFWVCTHTHTHTHTILTSGIMLMFHTLKTKENTSTRMGKILKMIYEQKSYHISNE